MDEGIWFAHLLLLGFDPSQSEDKHKIPFHKKMFDLPNNKRGMEVVLHFLFVQLDPAKAASEFRDCWKVYDRKQEQSFRKVCVQWFAAIARVEPHSSLPRQAASILLSPEGDKFYTLLLNFSYYCVRSVLVQMLQKLDNKIHVHTAITDGCGNIDPSFADAYEYSLSVGIVNHTHHVISRLHSMNDSLHPQWRQYAIELSEEYRNVSRKRTEMMSLLSNLKKAHGNLKLTKQIRDNEREIMKSKVLKLWSDVDAFIKSTKVEREILHDIVMPSHDYHVIDGKDLQYKVPVDLSSDNSEHTPNSGPLDLTRLLDTGNNGLLLLKDQLIKGVRSQSPGLVPLKEELQFARSEVRQHKSHLQSAKSTRTLLYNHYEQLKIRVNELQESVKLLQLQQNEEKEENMLQLPTAFKPGTDITMTPPYSAPPLLLDTRDISSTPMKRPALPQHYTVSTPLAVEKFTKEMSTQYRHGNDMGSSLRMSHTPNNIPNSTNTVTHTPARLQNYAHPLNHTPLSHANQPETRVSQLRRPSAHKGSPLLNNAPLLVYNKVTRNDPPVNQTDSISTPVNHTDLLSTPANHTDPISTPANSTDPISTPANHTDPISTPANHTDPISTPVNHTDPISTPANHTDPISTPDHVSTPANHADPVSTPLASITNKSSKNDTSLDVLASKIVNDICSDDSSIKSGSGNNSYSNDCEPFITKEILTRTPNVNSGIPYHMSSDQLIKPVIADDSSLDFDLLENEIPPTPYRDVGLMSPDDMRTRTRNRNEDMVPLILEDSVLT